MTIGSPTGTMRSLKSLAFEGLLLHRRWRLPGGEALADVKEFIYFDVGDGGHVPIDAAGSGVRRSRCWYQ